jgi:type I restriction-modification system DNA methylase subunit
MIFRGDGKTNIYNENCFKFNKFGKRFAKKVLMNPPYAQVSEPETMFIDHGLESLEPGKILAAIFTYSVLCDKPNIEWRENLLDHHTVLAAVTMPPDLFYPTGSNTCILLCKAHIPHKGKIWFCRIDNDGYKIKRKKRVERDGGQLEKALKMFKSRETYPELSEEPGFSCYTELDPNDGTHELVPEAYLASPDYPDDEIQHEVDNLLRESAAFSVKYHQKLDQDEQK